MHGNDPRGIVVQERDRHLFEELALMRVIDREQARIVAGFGSTTQVNTRLLELTRGGLLRRFFLGATAAGRKAIYTLSPKGAALIGVPARGPRRRNDETLAADSFVLHQTAVNQIYCAVKYGMMPAPGISFSRWVAFSNSLAPGRRLIPDGYFQLTTPSGTMAAFLELDRGYERLAVWNQKVGNYLQSALSGDFERRFGQKQFRVLVVADSDRRLFSIRKAVRAYTQKIFWFTTLQSIQSQGFFAPIWMRPAGDERQSLLPKIP